MNSPSATTTAILTAIIAGAAAVAKKVLPGRKPEYISRAEFHQEMTATRERIGASYLAMADKLDAQHKEAMAGLGRLAVVTEERLDRLETGLARVDERTKF